MLDDDDECSCSAPEASSPSSPSTLPFPLELAPVREGPGFRIFELFGRTRFSWGNVASSGRLTYDLTPYIPLADVPEALVVVRIHSISVTAGARAELVMELVAPTTDDASTTFLWTLPLASVVIDASGTAGTCVVARLRCDVGHYARTRIHLDQHSSPVSATIELSAELIARTSTDERRRPCDRE